jgi:hypothetical protein
MMKQQKTAAELAAMIEKWIGIIGVKVTVYPDGAGGWNPNVSTEWTDPTRVFKCRRRADEIAAELRTTYDLKV